MKLTRDQILEIPVLAKDLSIDEIAVKLGVSPSAVNYQIRRLRNNGFKVPVKRGRRALKLK
jgi:biotin operon repressor